MLKLQQLFFKKPTTKIIEGYWEPPDTVITIQSWDFSQSTKVVCGGSAFFKGINIIFHSHTLLNLSA